MYPIILCHGVCRFDVFWKDILATDNNNDPEVDKFHYFKGIRTMLIDKGFKVWHSSVPWGASVKDRAAVLKQNIENIVHPSSGNADKVHLIAHSMGGLDARHMMFDDRNNGQIHTKIASLTTISTPHHGTAFADWGTDHLMEVIHIAGAIGLDLKALPDLRTDRCQAFNNDPKVKDFENKLSETVLLQTYAGQQNWDGVFWPLKISHKIIKDKEGVNDGLVSVESAMWRKEFFCGNIRKVDHLNELGWWDASQIVEGESRSALLDRIHALYLEIAENLGNR